LQHWREGAYLAWKSGLVEAALRRAGFADVVLAPCVVTPPLARRRVDLAIRRHGATLTIGLHTARSSEVIDLAECPVLHPVLFSLIARIRPVLRSLTALRREGSAIFNLLESGPDLLLRLDGKLSTPDRTRLAAFAEAQGIPRIATAEGKGVPEVACLRFVPNVAFAGTKVTPPPGAFLQASAEGQVAITAAVLAGLPGHFTNKARIVELYAGCGTLTFPLAGRTRVEAYEGDAPAAQALKAAVNASGQAGRITAHHRDLTRQPLSVKELSGAAAIVLDPPHAGATVQMEQVAAAGVKRVIYVSCNPAALARDAELLHRAGYRLMAATPIDQFLWSARIESVAVFARG
jgi:23S rRNA (uracil1939-C5)-methyltransferase